MGRVINRIREINLRSPVASNSRSLQSHIPTLQYRHLQRSNVHIQEIAFSHPIEAVNTTLEKVPCPDDKEQSYKSAEYQLPLIAGFVR